MNLNKRILLLTLTPIFFNLSSCGDIKIKDVACAKMSDYSSIPVDDLLKEPDSVKINDKEFKLDVSSNTSSGLLDSTISKFPNNLLPKVENHCSSVTRGTVSTLESHPDTIATDLSSYKPERIWFIDNQNKVWETSNISFEANSKNFKIQESGPNWSNIYTTRAVLKFTYNNNTYFIKSWLRKSL